MDYYNSIKKNNQTIINYIQNSFNEYILKNIQKLLENNCIRIEYINFRFEYLDFKKINQSYSLKKFSIIFHNFIHIGFNNNFNISNATFLKTVEVNNCTINCRNCTFEEPIKIYKSSSIDINILNTNYKTNYTFDDYIHDIHFTDCNIKKSFEGEKVNFHSKIKFDFCNSNNFEIGSLNFKNSTFKDKFFIKKEPNDNNYSVKIETINISECNFENSVEIVNLTLKNVVNFSNTTFNKKVVFGGTQFNTNIENGNVKNLDTDVYFNLFNTKFIELADFASATFFEPVVFENTDFNKVVVFSAATFKNNAIFMYCKIEDHIVFRNTIFNMGVDLSTSLIADINKINIFNLESIKLQKNYENDIEDNNDYESKMKKGKIVLQNARETFRIFKASLAAQNNHIDALKYQALENEVYLLQLKKDWCNNLVDYLILISNKYSNNFKQSWIRSFLLTFCFGVWIFLLFKIDKLWLFFSEDQ